jgi:hypothetical protein
MNRRRGTPLDNERRWFGLTPEAYPKFDVSAHLVTITQDSES